MEQPEQNVFAQTETKTELPKPAALQDMRSSDAAVSGTSGPTVFETQKVSIYYGSFRAVTDVSLTIHENEITAFIGPSGCGKTTVLRTLNRMNDLVAGDIDAGLLWGPIAGYRAARASVPMHVQLLLKDTSGPRLVYRITMGVRPSDQNWKRQLNTLIAQNHEAIDKVLLDFAVPLLDANDQPITGDPAPKP